MPPKSPYTFTAPQVKYLKCHLGSYMKAFDNEDSVNAIPRELEAISSGFVNQFKPEEKDKKAIKLSVDLWFNYKAQRIEKKRMLSVELRVYGQDMFRREKWECTIRPAVIKALGHSNSRDKDWIGMVQKVVGRQWSSLSKEERGKYDLEAKKTNEQNSSRENKIHYADNFFKKKIKKFITDLAGLCEARIMVWTIRETLEGKDKLVSIIEDDTGPKFMHEKHPDDLNDVNWHGGEWLDWMEASGGSMTIPNEQRVPAARNVRDYFLRLGPSGEMEMPSPDTHATGGNWASPLAKLVQIAWGRANGLKTQLAPKYKIFAADPDRYLDVKTYLPAREMLEEDFVWVKPCNMPVQQLLAWAVHLYARQERRKNGEDIEVLAFYAIDKRRRQLTSSGADEGSGTSRPTTKGGKRATKASDGSNARPGIRADLSGDETVGQSPTLEKNIVFEAGSPGAAGMYWKDRVIFLKSLCQSKEYQKLLGWLNEHQTRSSLSAPDGWKSRLTWTRWTYTSRWLPIEMYEDESGFESVSDYVLLWKKSISNLAGSKSHLEHLLLTVGMISRDIHAYQFSTADPDDMDGCPSYCHNSFFNLEYHDTLMSLLEIVHKEAILLFAAQAKLPEQVVAAGVQDKNSEVAAPAGAVAAGSLARSGVGVGQNQSENGTQSDIPPIPSKGRPKPRQPARKGKSSSKGHPSPDDGNGADVVGDQRSNGSLPEASTQKTIIQANNESPGDHDSNHEATGRAKKGKRPGQPKTVPPLTSAKVVSHYRQDEVGVGRKSGRLREKGTTSYTAKGEIIRGGKRVNEDIHEQPFTKKTRC